MPWMETAPMEQRERFIRDHRGDLYTMAEFCARYGISRTSGSRGSMRRAGRVCRIEAGRHISAPTASPMRSRR